MRCSDLPKSVLRQGMAVINTEAPRWASLRTELGLDSTKAQSACFKRLTQRGELVRLRRGIYVPTAGILDVPELAIASGAVAHLPHYVTTDRALEHHGLINQPIVTTTVVVAGDVAPIPVGSHVLRFVKVAGERVARAQAFDTAVATFPARVASRQQAVLDALVEPGWMLYLDLLPEVLSVLDPRDVERLAEAVMGIGSAPAQRLGYLLDEARAPVPHGLAALQPRSTAYLDPARKRTGSFSTRWRLYG